MEDILKQILSELQGIKEGQNKIDKKLDAVIDQTAVLTEFRTEVNTNLEIINDDVKSLQTDMDVLVVNSAKNTADIIELKKVK